MARFEGKQDGFFDPGVEQPGEFQEIGHGIFVIVHGETDGTVAVLINSDTSRSSRLPRFIDDRIIAVEFGH